MAASFDIGETNFFNRVEMNDLFQEIVSSQKLFDNYFGAKAPKPIHSGGLSLCGGVIERL